MAAGVAFGMFRPLIIVIVLLAAVPAARADLPKVPSHAKRMTRQLAYDAAWGDGMHRIATDARWKAGAVLVVQSCRVVSRRRGWCEYTLSAVVKDPVSGYALPGVHGVCRWRVTTRIGARSHRVSSRSKALGCGQRTTSGP